MKRRILPGAILILGILLLAYQFLFYAREATGLRNWRVSGYLESEWERDSEESPWIITHVDSLDFSGAPVPEAGDTLLSVTIGDGAALDPVELREIVTPPDQDMAFAYRSEGGERVAAAVTRARPIGRQITQIALEIIRFFVTLGYLLVGLWALVRQPNSQGVRALALFSFAMAGFMIVAVSVDIDRYMSFAIPGQSVISGVLSSFVFFVGAFWIHLQLHFPTTLGWVRRHPVLIPVLLYLPQALFLVADVLPQVRVPEFASFVILAVQLSLGFVILGIRGGTTKDQLEKRQIRLVQWGTGIGIGSIFVLVILGRAGLLARISPQVVLLMVTLMMLLLLLSPLSFAYAFGRYCLLEVEGKLRRGTRYFIVTAVLLLLFMALLYGISELLLGSLGVASRAPTLLLALLLAIGFTPLQRWIQAQLERRFYPERQRLRALLADFHATAAALPDRRALWLNLEESLKQGLGISAVIPLIQEGEADEFQLPDGSPSPFAAGGGLARLLGTEGRPLLVDELLASDRAKLDEEQVAWLVDRKAAVLLPMLRRSRLLGLLVLAFEEDAEQLTPDTLRELSGLASQVALESENLRLLEETIDKRRLEEQLDMARQVQEGFLPQNLPATPGLKVAARFRASLEVAGDYYDVLALPEDRTLMAVGDVSGKGAGAAMIMANLQASLRSMAKVGVPLREMIAGINDLIHENTPVEQFITFFATVYDPRSKTLCYVNAGHNPPRLIRRDGSHRELDVGGPILGIVPGTVFEEETVALEEGDLLLAFTDGVSEAMNAAEEEFGEERIVEVVRPLRSESPERALETVEREVTAFLGGLPLGDDFTLLIASARG